MSKRVTAAISGLALAVLSVARLVSAEPLAADTRDVTGSFDNGLKYVIRTHANPPGRVWFFLRVDTGALNETDPQNGLAHFIEHMAFNGSKNFKAGELIPLLNSLGMQFGVHTNASTDHMETVYKLQMPDADPKTVDTALKIFSDYADGLLFEPKEIEEERGVVIEEWRSGKSVDERTRKQTIKDLFPDSRINLHDVIGTDENLHKVGREEFLDYWNTWYRPERMTLIVVGDITPDKVIEPARKALGQFKARAAARQPGKAEFKQLTKAQAFIVTDPEQVSCDVTVLTTGESRPPVTTTEQFQQNLTENVGQWIMNRRLEDLLQKGQASYQSADVGTTDLFKEVRLITASAQGNPADWNKMLAQIIDQVQGAIAYGFTPRELDLAKSAVLAGAERAVETEATIDAGAIVNGITASINRGNTITSAATRLELTKKYLALLNLDAVNAAFKTTYGDKKYTYVLTLPANKTDFTTPTDAAILAAADAAWASPAVAIKDEAAASSLLAAAPTPGKAADTRTDDALKVTTVTFENGVVFHYRFNDYKKDQVAVRVTMPGGRIAEAGATIGLSEAANAALGQPATSRLSSTQIRDLMTGKKISVGGGFGSDSLNFAVSGSPRELDTGMQLLYALITDSKLEQAAFDEWKKSSLLAYEESLKGLQGLVRHTIDKTVMANDPRFVSLTPEVINRITPEAAQAWLKNTTDNAAIEVGVVGDISLEDATAMVSKYLGSLPKRTQTFSALDTYRKIDRSNSTRSAEVTGDIIAPMAIAIAGFEGADAENVSDFRKLRLVANILTVRMIKRIREDEQLVYSIGVQSSPGQAVPGMGMFMAAAPVDPKNAGRLADEIIEMMKTFAKEGPTEAEMTTMRKQEAKELETQMKEPGFWLGQIGDMTYRKRSADAIKQLPDIYQTFTADELRETAAMYFTDDTKKIRIIVSPKPKADAAPATQPAK